MDSRPAESDLLKLVGDHTDAKWREFSIRLGVSSNTCDSIRQEALGVPKECFILMCSKWLSCEVGTGDKDRTWRTVLEAVRLSGFPELADKLEQSLLCEYFQYRVSMVFLMVYFCAHACESEKWYTDF